MAEVSVQQMALTRNTEFMDRVQAMMARIAGVVLNEPAAMPYNYNRVVYAKQVTMSPFGAAQTAGPQVVMGVNVVAATTYDEDNKTAACSIADIDLESQITTLWNSLAGISTPA